MNTETIIGQSITFLNLSEKVQGGPICLAVVNHSNHAPQTIPKHR